MSNQTPYQIQKAKKEEWRKRYWAVVLEKNTDEALKIATGIILSQLEREKKTLKEIIATFGEPVEVTVAPKPKTTKKKSAKQLQTA